MNPLLSALSQWAEALANTTLALDSQARQRLARLEGQTIQIETDPGESVTIEFCGERVRVMARSVDHPNAIVRGSPASLLGAGFGGSPADLRIDGDEILIEELRNILRDLKPDFGEPLARLIGAQNADNIAGFLELGGRALRRLAGDLSNEGSRTIRAAAHRQFVDARSLDQFSEQVLAAQLATDRLGARLQRLEGAQDLES
jgi:ubiquinone biosynthesis protein UbiJ